MADDLAGLAVSVGRMPEAIREGQAAGVRKAALQMTRAIRGEIRVASGADSRLSGVGRRGVRVGARFDVRGKVNPTALIRATGPLQLIERDTKAHDIGPRRKYARGSRKKKPAIKFGGRYAPGVRHPGTRGRAPFARGVERTRDLPATIIDSEIWRRVKGTF